jgi:hypothetical protein
MSEPDSKKTIAIRVSPDLRGRLDSVLQITGMNVNQAGTEALEKWIADKLADPKVRERALRDLEAEQRALEERRKALQGLVGEATTAEASPDKPTRGRSSGKP